MERFPCDPTRECRLRETIGCFEDVHHRQWPRRAYQSPVAKEFRDLDENKELTCRDRHNEIHATEMPPEKPPEKPSVADMRVAVEVSRLALRVAV
jgi:hypothetical protein